jgi:hypothetical protein
MGESDGHGDDSGDEERGKLHVGEKEKCVKMLSVGVGCVMGGVWCLCGGRQIAR